MKFKLLCTSMILFLSQSALAEMPPRPEKCPDVSAIQSRGVADIERGNAPGKWFASVLSNSYHTKELWTFVLGPIEATDENDAKNKAVTSLASLTLEEGPLPVEWLNRWVCTYNNKSGYSAVAVTPAVNAGMQLHSVVNFKTIQ